MAEQTHEELRRIFGLAFAVPAAQRDSLLDRECGGDAALKQRIVAMIAAAEDDRFLAEPTADVMPTAEVDPSASAPRIQSNSAGSSRGSSAENFQRESPGTKIGPYKLLQLIGEGGFGSVFMAEQEKPVARKVALKIIKLGMDTRQVVARFEQERQALAMMDHPNIARVLDAGATEAGRPYFVMDLVKGDPIAAYCDKNNLSIEARLGLFEQVCAAVQHAHTKGIIHRDIKPSNILVATQDGRPSAKVIDFGIAKATQSKLTEKTLFTEHQQLIGTPEYMSPEQAEGSLDIDTRTDVYSLGVLLYELLTGSTPFSSKELRSAAFGEIQRIIREVDPPKPSTRISEATDTIATVAAKRQTEPRKLGLVVRGELDWIVMKALEKDRQRRYETANGLAMDVRRYLSGEAVVAAPISRTYRFKKFVRRNKGAVSAGTAIAAALLVGVVGFAWQAARATRAEGVARTRLAESEATVGFLDQMLGSVDPSAMGKDVTVRAVLDEASKTVGEKFADRPLVAARLRGTIGRTYMALSVYDVAEPHMREALAIRQRELGAAHPDTSHAVNELGALLIKNGSHAEAEALLKKAIDDHTKLFGRRDLVTLESLDLLAMLYGSQLRPELAEPLLKEVLEIRTATLGKEDPTTVASMNTLATIGTDLRKFDESERLFETSIAIQDRLTGPDHPRALELRSNYAWMQYWAAMDENLQDLAVKNKRLESARTIGERVLRTRERVLGADHQATATSINNLALVYQQLGMMLESEALRKRDLEITLRTLGESHPDSAVSLANFGSFLQRQRRYEEAITYLERSVKISRQVLPPDNPGLGFTLGWYGSCLRDVGRFTESEPALIEARGVIGRSMGEDHPIAAQMSESLFTLYEKWNKAEPGRGYDAKAAEWKAKMPAPRPEGTEPKSDEKK